MRKLVAVVFTAFFAVVWVGCGGSAEFNKSADYTPESLAQELIFRFKDLNAEARVVSSKGGKGKTAAPASEKEQKKAGEAKKEAPANDADAVLDDVVSKIRLITGIAPSAACKQIADTVRKDVSLDPKERDGLADRLEALSKEL